MHPFAETQKQWLRNNIPPFRAGDTLRVNVRVREGDKERLQAFEGVCLGRRGSGVSETFTVRKISNGAGVCAERSCTISVTSPERPPASRSGRRRCTCRGLTPSKPPHPAQRPRT